MSWGRRAQGLASAATVALALVLPASSAASFPGQNGKVFFEGPEPGNSSGPADIYSINPDGSEKLNLTPGTGDTEERPAVSADGHRVVFQSFRDGGWNIIAMNADGSGQVDLTKTKDPVINFEPTWSADGTKVAFMRQNEPPGQDIWVIDANGTGAMDLTNTPGVDETAPEFSPDGKKIVYMSTGPGVCCSPEYNNDIWAMDANGANQTQLTTTDFETQNFAPTWSPDGSKIAFSRNSTPSAIDNGIHVMNANGSGQARLLDGIAPIIAGGLAWSPDGSKIAYDREGSGGIYTISAGGGGSTPLITGNNVRLPSWAPAVAAATGAGGSSGSSPGGDGPAGPAAAGPPGKAAPKPAPLKCHKGKKRKVVHGKARCVRPHKGKKKH